MIRSLVTVLLLSTPSLAAADRPAEPFAPLAFLAGHCWSGTFPDGKAVDEHCFEFMWDRAFLKDVHVVTSPGKPDYEGETIYHWDGESSVIAYRYFNSLGGISDGMVSIDGDTLRFPDETYRNGDDVQVFRSSMKRLDSDHYLAITEQKTEDGWTEAFRIKFKREPRE